MSEVIGDRIERGMDTFVEIQSLLARLALKCAEYEHITGIQVKATALVEGFAPVLPVMQVEIERRYDG